MTTRSLTRPVTNSSPSIWKPRSPVRRNGPRPVSARNAENVSAVSAGPPQEPWDKPPACEPDLPTLASRMWPPGHRIHDEDLVAALCAATAYERRGGRVIGGGAHELLVAQGH